MRRSLAVHVVLALAIFGLTSVVNAGEKSRYGVDASEWDSGTVAVPDVILPIGGSGQVNGEFVTGERNGVQIAIRASERFLGPVDVRRQKNAGVYEFDTGYSTPGLATWNYDLHVDLRGAQGVAAGKALGDYTLVLDSDIGSSLFGCAFPCEVTLPGTTLLWQTSLNPVFGSTGFDPTAEDLYYFTFTLTPKTFKGPPITVRMKVDVSNP